MFWWKITHNLDYRGETIIEISYVQALTTIDALHELMNHTNPARVLFDLHGIEICKIEEHDVDSKRLIYSSGRGELLRSQLVSMALEWEKTVGIIPHITTVISEYDASKLMGFAFSEYSSLIKSMTAVQKGYDFIFADIRYQIKACRPSGKKGSKITMVPKVKNYHWDKLIWIQYDRQFRIEEAWLWNVYEYKQAFHEKKRICPTDMWSGQRLV
jgi:hypothetical protein